MLPEVFTFCFLSFVSADARSIKNKPNRPGVVLMIWVPKGKCWRIEIVLYCATKKITLNVSVLGPNSSHTCIFTKVSNWWFDNSSQIKSWKGARNIVNYNRILLQMWWCANLISSYKILKTLNVEVYSTYA